MELYVARQPIFDTNKSIAGYELLHRESDRNNEYTQADGEFASSRVISTAFLSMGLDSLSGGRLAFINFTGDLLTSGVASLLPKELLVIEILETVAPTRAVLAACEKLKADGYTLALDDYVLSPVFDPFARLADIIKVDFRKTTEKSQYAAILHYRDLGIQFLAEKIESEEEFNRASKLGYTLFQGYFFAKPVILKSNAMLAGKLGYIRLMQAVNEETPDIGAIVSAIECDVTLAMETIKLSNSAYYGRRQKISSIRQAVVALGLDGVRKWIYLSALRRLGTGKPDVLVSTSVIRSKFMEMLAQASGQSVKSPEYAMLGLLSLLDALTGTSFETLLAELNISEDTKDVLVNGVNRAPLGTAFKIVTSYERGQWEDANLAAQSMGISLDMVAIAYITSLRWYNDFMKISEG